MTTIDWLAFGREITRTDDMPKETPMLHCHIESREVDCDGPLDRFYTEQMNDDERADEQMGEYHFQNRILAHVVHVHPLHTGRLDVTQFDDGTSRLSWSEQTEEGGRNVEATFCTDPGCENDGPSQRDHFAEAAGY